MRRLLAVHAHPDDETLATGVLLAAAGRRGVEAHVLTCTLGEEGEVIPGHLAHLQGAPGDPLAEHRRDELAAALAALGASGHLLRAAPGRPGTGAGTAYRDSGMAGAPSATHPRALVGAPLGEVAARVRDVVEALRPDLVVTYDREGGYRHPDHVRVHEATVRAVAALPGPPPLYAVCTPASWAREDRRWLAEHVPRGAGWLVPAADEPYPPSVVDDPLVGAVVIDPAAVAAQVAALAAHATQVVARDGWFALSNHVAGRLPGREGFARLDPRTGRVVPPTAGVDPAGVDPAARPDLLDGGAR
ncbi:MAG TPA: PIG-L family deacetylase [Dermatophilaceae bacterium]|nr:PIG-L family deacetylase [Dermatophilaceae bacterium]